MRRAPSGFTLVEVLVALAIFAIVAIPLLGLELSSTAQVAQVNLARRAHTVATSWMDRWTVEPFQGERTEEQDEFVVRGETDDVDEQPGLMRLRVTVTYEEEVMAELVAYRVP